MTSSETQTKARKGAKKSPRPQKNAVDSEPAVADADGEALVIPLDKRQARMLAWAVMVVLLIGGWLAILHVNHWHFGPPVFFLWTGWLAIFLTARFLWTAGMSAAYDDEDIDEEEFWKPVGERDELVHAKRSLLKAIKEIEFDYQMGKLSAKDANELTRFYRARTIEIIKALEGGQDQDLTIEQKIEREVKARLSVAGAKAKAKADTARAKSSKAGKDKAGAAGKSDAGADEDKTEAAGADENRTEAAGADETSTDSADKETGETAKKDDTGVILAASEDEPQASAEVGT